MFSWIRPPGAHLDLSPSRGRPRLSTFWATPVAAPVPPTWAAWVAVPDCAVRMVDPVVRPPTAAGRVVATPGPLTTGSSVDPPFEPASAPLLRSASVDVAAVEPAAST